jgi:hypothetical protein
LHAFNVQSPKGYMCINQKAQRQALRVGLAANTAMARSNSSMIDRKLAVNDVLVAVVLVFAAVVLMKLGAVVMN